ncbi:hypothetical protein D3C71_2125170 [compost metagenome]
MHLDTVEPGFDRIGGGLAEILDDYRDFVQRQRTRLRYIGKTIVHEGLGLGADC